MARIVVLSDIHLSPTHGFFWENWCIARDFANKSKADAVIVNGDLCINGPESDEEIAFAAFALSGLHGQVFPLPGNHDIGDEPPGQDPDQIINENRLARWDGAFGGDRWIHEADEWLLIGLNAQLFGSGLDREGEQIGWLRDRLSAASGRPVALFLHKPLFLDDILDDQPTISCIVPKARGPLLKTVEESSVRLVVSGHLHQHRDRILNGVRHTWAPAVAFAASAFLGGDTRCGLLTLDFEGRDVQVTVERPAGLVSYDLDGIKGHGQYRFLRNMPPCPPPGGSIVENRGSH